jgi:hypothetical protein
MVGKKIKRRQDGRRKRETIEWTNESTAVGGREGNRDMSKG